MKTKDTQALGRQRAKPSKIKAQYSRPTCKNCTNSTRAKSLVNHDGNKVSER